MSRIFTRVPLTWSKESSSRSNPVGGKSVHKLSQSELSERRAKSLCYFCDEKLTPEHYALKHKKTQLFNIEMDDEGEGDEEESVFTHEEEAAKLLPKISLNAVACISDYTTLRIKGMHNKRPLFVLIDSGSTHNFINPEVVLKLGCKIQLAEAAKVPVADGRNLEIQRKIDKFGWDFQQTSLEADVMLIPLKGCDMVLGVQWLETLGPIVSDYKKLE